MARKQLAEQWAENRRQRAEEERRQRVTVITEFDAGDPEATLHALAGKILRYPPGPAAAGAGGVGQPVRSKFFRVQAAGGVGFLRCLEQTTSAWRSRYDAAST